MEAADSVYKCAACGRSYKSASTPERCAVCGADGAPPQPDPERSADGQTDKFRLAADRAKGNFR